MYLIKLDSLGSLKWSKTIGGPKEETAYSVIQTKDKGYALAGYTGSFSSGPDNMYMVKLDSTGVLKWTRTLGNFYNSVAMSITQSKDDGYVLAGYIYSFVSGSNDLSVVKLDSVGALKWSNEVLGGAASANSIVQNRNGGYAITGVTTFFGAGGNDAYFLLLDSAGISCIPTDTAGKIIAMNKGTSGTGGTVNIMTPVISVDTSSSDTGGLYTNYCSKTKPTAVVPVRSVIQNKILVFPNPTIGNITLQYESENNETLCIRIIDMAGNILYSSANNKAQTGLNNYNINTISLAQGMYIIQIQNSQKLLYEKFVKL